MASDITLTAGMRSNLTSLQQTESLLNRTQGRLSTGKSVNSALDNPTNFFASAAHIQRAADFGARKDGMNEAIQTIKAADNGITGVKTLLASAKGLVESARSATASNRSTLATQYNEVLSQLNKLVADSGYKGTDFLAGTSVSLDVLFNEDGSNKITLTGFNANWSALGAQTATSTTTNYISTSNPSVGTALSAGTIISSGGGTLSAGYTLTSVGGSAPATAFGLVYTASVTTNTVTTGGVDSAANWSASTFQTTLNDAADSITAAVAALQTEASKLASNLSVLNARLDFTRSMINTLEVGADTLTLADTNEEGANMLALQTRQQLGVTSLSLASQAAQSVLRLF